MYSAFGRRWTRWRVRRAGDVLAARVHRRLHYFLTYTQAYTVVAYRDCIAAAVAAQLVLALEGTCGHHSCTDLGLSASQDEIEKNSFSRVKNQVKNSRSPSAKHHLSLLGYRLSKIGSSPESGVCIHLHSVK